MSEDTSAADKDQKPGFDFAPAVELLKAFGFIGGGIGSITLLFFYIGNAIIVARLRIYNLYGTVHYTDEYVKEAGYQFLQDLFTFFARWQYGLLFIFSLILIFLLIPLGPYEDPPPEPPADPSGEKDPDGEKTRTLHRSLCWLKAHYQKIRYLLFAVLGVTAAVLLTSGTIVQGLINKVIIQQQLLEEAAMLSENNLLAFNEKEIGIPKGGRRKIFHDDLYRPVQRGPDWIPDLLAATFGFDKEKSSSEDMLQQFRSNFNIKKEAVSLKRWEAFKKTKTFQALSFIKVNQDIERMLEERVNRALDSIRLYLGGHIRQDPEFLVVCPGVYDLVNSNIKRLEHLVENVDDFFDAQTDETRALMNRLRRIDHFRFASATLSFSFWVLIGLLIYLLLNCIQIIRFQRWEQVYFFFMALMFVIIAVSMPTIYGRYKFEFRVNKIKGFELIRNEKNLSSGSIEALQGKNINRILYTLGPTRGKEIIIASFAPPVKPEDATMPPDELEIMIFDKTAFRSMVLQPLPPEEIPLIIQRLRHGVK